MYKTLRNISNYIVGEDLQVINTITGEVVTPLDSGEIKLQTDEEMYLPTKDKTIKLVRRFTLEQIRKLYDQSDAIVDNATETDKLDTKTDKLELFSGQVEENGQVSERTSSETDKLVQGKLTSVSINGQVYNSLNEASKALGVGRNTIKRRIDSGKDGYSYV